MSKQVFAAKLGLTSCVFELTVHLLEGTFFTEVLVKVLTLEFVWCSAFTLWPVVGRYIMEGRLVALAVFTAEWSLWAFFGLVIVEETTLERLPTTKMITFNLHKRTPLEPCSMHTVNIQVFLEHFQLSLPLTAALMVGAVDLECFQGLIMGAVVHDSKVLGIAERAALSSFLNALDTIATKVMSAAADEVGGAKDQQADGALGLEVTWRWLDELALVSAVVVFVNVTHCLCQTKTTSCTKGWATEPAPPFQYHVIALVRTCAYI